MNTTHNTKSKRPEGEVMQTLCATRAVKVLKYRRRTVAPSVPRSSLDALEKLPFNQLASLHATSDWGKVTQDVQLREWLAGNPIPSAKAKVPNPLFHGTLVFVQLIFQEAGQPPSSVSAADMQTAINYAMLAVQPIQRYAWQYGPNDVSVWPNVMPFPVNVTGASFTTSQFEGWVEQCAKAARNQKINNPCIVVLHNRDLPNTPQFSGQRNSFHSMTGDGTPYCYCLVFGENLTVADNNHTINGALRF